MFLKFATQVLPLFRLLGFSLHALVAYSPGFWTCNPKGFSLNIRKLWFLRKNYQIGKLENLCCGTWSEFWKENYTSVSDKFQ